MESIASMLGFYNFLSYIIPGLLYLYVLSRFVRLLHLRHVDIASVFQESLSSPSILTAIIIVLAGFVIAQLFSPIAKFIFHTLTGRKNFAAMALKSLRHKNSSLQIKFEPSNFELLFTIIRQRNPETARLIEHFQGQSLMFRNLSFGLLLLSIVEFIHYFEIRSMEYIVVGLFVFSMCLVANDRSDNFRIWFFERIFESSLEYGCSLEEVLAHGWEMKSEMKSKVQTRKK